MYVFENSAPQAAPRLTALADVFDPGTIRHLAARGVAEGWTCLEIGAGLGTIAHWLAERVGPHGRVLATDIDTRHLETGMRANVEVRRHDVATDPLPPAAFDLAHSRLLLSHLADPDRALERMVAAVKPGGWLLVEDFERLEGTSDLDRLSKTATALRQVVAAAGWDARLGRSLARRLREHGLEDVGAEGRVLLYQAGTAGATLWRLNFEQLRAPILATGLVTDEEFAADVAALDGADFEMCSPILWSAWGRKPRP